MIEVEPDRAVRARPRARRGDGRARAREDHLHRVAAQLPGRRQRRRATPRRSRASSASSRALANEWAPHGVNVNAIAPGYIETDNTQALRDDPSALAAILDRIPAGRWGEPEDLAGAAVFLASAGVRLRARHRAAGRRRLARPMTTCSSTPARTRVLPVRRASRRRRRAAPLGRGTRPPAGSRAIEVTLPHRRRRTAIARARRGSSGSRRRGHGDRSPSRSTRRVAAGARFIVSPGLDERGRRALPRTRACRSSPASRPRPRSIARARLGLQRRQVLPGRAARRRRAASRALARAVPRGCASSRPAGSTRRRCADYLAAAVGRWRSAAAGWSRRR